ncbi:hypothetical protein K438DRAFT_1066071 [Mycena galopus ATCC 62051]|nr:hypothetical protein K438DRAFT_1066071 [Mycena galopus ATCC 62051]
MGFPEGDSLHKISWTTFPSAQIVHKIHSPGLALPDFIEPFSCTGFPQENPLHLKLYFCSRERSFFSKTSTDSIKSILMIFPSGQKKVNARGFQFTQSLGLYTGNISQASSLLSLVVWYSFTVHFCSTLPSRLLLHVFSFSHDILTDFCSANLIQDILSNDFTAGTTFNAETTVEARFHFASACLPGAIQFLLTALTYCEGFHNPEHEGWVYQKCPNHVFNHSSSPSPKSTC